MSPINLKTKETSSAIKKRNVLNVKEMLMKACLKRLLYTFSLNLSNLRPICVWQNITRLTLSKCDISFLPMELDLLPFLKTISLSQNHLAKSKWTWLEQATIKKNLIHLDIGSNSLTKLPLQIVKLNSLIRLRVCDNKLRHLPPSIGCLKNLKELLLSKCDISFLPMELGLLPFLKVISLSQNHLAQSKWTWLEQATIKKNLTYLDIGGNSLTKLPLQIVHLNSLICLTACDNKLRHLPPGIGCLKSLKYLLLQRNNLLYLPATLKYLQLHYLDITENSFLFNADDNFKNNLNATQTLMEWSAKIISRSRIPYDASVIPSELVKYLDEANYCCICKEACIDSYIKQHVRIYNRHTLTPNVLAQMVWGEPDDFVNIECYFCSVPCHRKKYNIFSFDDILWL